MCIPPQITCRPDWRSAKTCSGVRSLSELSIGDYSSAMSICQVNDELFVSLIFLLSYHLLCVFAGVHLLLSHTCLTLHVAAPAYLAVAGQAGEAHGCVVTTSAAHTLTTGVFGTRPAACTRGVARGPAEAGGVFQVDQVSSTKALAMATGPSELRLPGGCVGDTQHSHRGVIPVLQQPSSVMERRQLLPASPYGTRAGDTVTLAGCFQPTLHCLRCEKKKQGRGRKCRDVSSFSLIHYLASYLGGLSGQSETVSCRVGRGLGVVVWERAPLAHLSQNFWHNGLRGTVQNVVFHLPHISHLDSSCNFFSQCVETSSVCFSPVSFLKPEALVTNGADSGISPPCSLYMPAHGKHW